MMLCSEEEYTRRIEELRAESEQAEAELRRLYREIGLEESLRESFWLLEFDDHTKWAESVVSEHQRLIIETFGNPIEAYSLLRRLTLEHDRQMRANTIHAAARERVRRIRQEFKDNWMDYPSKLKFAEEVADREGVDVKTVYDRWLRYL